jgi:hypothetical protein
MSFVRGPYDYKVDPACAAKFYRTLEIAERKGTARASFFDELWRVYGDIQLGKRPLDLDALPIDDHYSVSIFGYRVHLKIDQHEMFVEIADVEDA